jgi:murein DD-endopeptidase MepM/ murein hydrolase activator NlpD
MRRFLYFFLIIIAGCNPDPIFPLPKKNISIVPVKNFSIAKLNFPKDGYISIDENQSIYDIANTYNILPQEIIRANNLKPPYELSKDQQIYLPYPLMHKVNYNQNIYDVSLIYAVSQSDIVELNGLRKPYKLIPDVEIKIPLRKDYSVIGLKSKTKITKKSKTNPISKINSKFLFPVNGKIVKDFGPFDNGNQHNDGVNILVSTDQPIKASMSGKVAFVGSNLKSFGKMILIKHDSKFVTAYARINEFNVMEGDLVKKGQTIGRIYKNNSVHFQIRKSRNPVNPNLYIN